MRVRACVRVKLLGVVEAYIIFSLCCSGFLSQLRKSKKVSVHCAALEYGVISPTYLGRFRVSRHVWPADVDFGAWPCLPLPLHAVPLVADSAKAPQKLVREVAQRRISTPKRGSPQASLAGVAA